MRRVVVALLAVLVLGATAVRVAPLVEGGSRLQRQCVSEDGYLMLTIARNLALGNGPSISDGQIASNGFQPLATLLFAGGFRLVGGDKQLGLYVVVAFQFLLCALVALHLAALVRHRFYRGPDAELVAVVAACLWYASPSSIVLSQNGLETGLYAWLVFAAVGAYDALAEKLRRASAPVSCLLLGVLLGLTFLARNDACFLIASLLGAHVVLGLRARRFGRALSQALITGATSVAVAGPWLWFNVTRFGHLVPVSGRAEALNVSFANNLWPAFAALVELALLFVRIPERIQAHAGFAAISVVIVAGGLAAAWWGRRWLAARFSIGVGILAAFAGLLFLYYALFFGMPSFLPRYFFPAAAIFALLLAAGTPGLVSRAATPVGRRAAGAVVVGLAACSLALQGRIYLQGTQHLHFQVVDWVTENVPQEVWVGAVQTGTLGFYHDRTVNLDGKVDPGAFAARKAGRIHEYVIEREVEYIADWNGVAAWAEWPEFAANYELLVDDPGRNLAVLRRRRPAVNGGS
jgi:hypothetical protein